LKRKPGEDKKKKEEKRRYTSLKSIEKEGLEKQI
jgi:hypothetical protein